MRKPVYVICEQQKRRSACASVQSDQRLCFSLPRSYNSSRFYIRNFKSLASFCSCAGRYESTLFANPKDRFSRDKAHFEEYILSAWFEVLRPSLQHAVMSSSFSDVRKRGILWTEKDSKIIWYLLQAQQAPVL